MNLKLCASLILSLCLSGTSAVMGESSHSFSHIVCDDISDWERALDIYIDENGCVWINSGDGISRYDSNGLTAFRPGPDPSRNFHTPGAKKITGDGNGTIFICGPTNLCAFDTRTMTFRDLLKEDVKTICYNGSLFLCQGNKVSRYDAAKDSIELFHLFPEDYLISSIDCAEDGAVWVGTEFDGAFKLDSCGRICRRLETESRVTSIFTDSRGEIWVGTTKSGILLVSPDGSRRIFRAGKDKKHTPASDFVRCFCEDNLGNIWAGTFTGLDCYLPEKDEFIHFTPDPAKNDALTHNSIWSIKKDSQGTLWIGTFFGGVNYINPEIDIFTKYPVSETEENCLHSPIIGQMAEDSKGNLWIATEGGGLHYLDRKTGRIRWYDKTHTTPHLSENNIKSILLDENNSSLWIGTHVGGLNRLDLKTGKISVLKSGQGEKTSPKSNIINALETIGDSLFIGSTGGLDIFNTKTSEFTDIPQNSENDVSVPYVNNLFKDSDGVLWIKTESDRIVKYWSGKGYLSDDLSGEFPKLQDSRGGLWTKAKGNTVLIHRKDSISEINIPNVCAIAESPKSGRIYILSLKGLFSYDQNGSGLKEFNYQNEFSISRIRPRSILVCRDGTIFIGGTKGLVSIDENCLNFREKPYRMFFTKLYSGNEEVIPGDPSGLLEKSLQYCQKIRLTPNLTSFTIEFATSNFLPFGYRDFQYRMSGVTDGWTSTRGHSFLTFNNLKRGNHLLEIKPTFDNPQICSPISIMIQVPPKWYGTILAWVIYLLLGGSIIFVTVSLFYSRKRASDIEELNQSKLRFFTNISHEIRTPLTIITAEVESIMQQHNCSPAMYRKILSIYKNCQSLRELITELLEFRKQEQGEMKIKAAPHDIVHFTNEFFLLYSEYAESKGVKLLFEKDIERLEVWYDSKQLTKVLNNILSNALKFTGSGGSIKIHVFSEGSNSIIEISDTGCGIPDSELENIFKRFYQVNTDNVPAAESRTGTGIGLALAKGIIELHKGAITVQSEIGKGTCFRVSLPLGYSHFTKEQIAESLSGDRIETADKLSQMEFSDASETPEPQSHRIIIAEDNDSVREILVKLFSPHYSVCAVKDGLAAWNAVKEEMPSLVLSDVLMPRMTGTELCKKIKNNPSTNHIPVVLLTARVAVEQTMEGLLTGADDYVTKPFNSALLLSRCNNLVNSRIKLREKYSRQPEETTLMLATSEMEKNFLDKAGEIIKKHLEESDFDIAVLARELSLSRSGLFKKIKAISGQTPNDFILSYRLRQGAILLKTRPELNITEISEKIGFNSPRYFSKCFKDKYELTPLAYRNSEKKQAKE